MYFLISGLIKKLKIYSRKCPADKKQLNLSYYLREPRLVYHFRKLTSIQSKTYLA